MHCPACRLPLVTAEVRGVELDYCAVDLGIWFDAGEIEALLHATRPVLAEHRSGERGQRRCPRCDQHMHVVSPAPNLHLDVCAHGDGVWFDKGEVGQLADALKAQGGDAQLADVFARLQLLLGGN